MATASWYGLGLKDVLSGAVNLDTGTLKAAILSSSYTPNVDTDHFWSAISASEVSGTGYTAGGIDVSANVTFNYDAATNKVQLKLGADVVWSSSTITGRYVVFRIDTGSAATSPLICYQDAGTNIVSSGGAWTFSPASGGIADLTVV